MIALIGQKIAAAFGPQHRASPNEGSEPWVIRLEHPYMGRMFRATVSGKAGWSSKVGDATRFPTREKARRASASAPAPPDSALAPITLSEASVPVPPRRIDCSTANHAVTGNTINDTALGIQIIHGYESGGVAVGAPDHI